MPIITIILVLIIIGVILWLINTYIPMAASIKTIINIVVVLCVIIWLLSVFGIVDIGSLKNITHSKLK